MIKSRSGFTIVELLIVIVVIGILAAITMVAYNGIQNRASNTAIQSDLRNLATKVLEQTALTGEYPTSNGITITGIPSFPVSKNSYSTAVHNLYYCTGLINNQREFAVAATSKSGERFKYTSMDGASTYTGAWGGGGNICPGLGFINGYTQAYGFYFNTQTWNAWAQ